jgi:zinc/manganese transport system substrate-binding protein
MSMRTAAAAVLAMSMSIALAGCGSGEPAGAKGDSSGRIVVVASTNVWGDVVKQVGGDAVEVTSLITDPSQDPHSFEASATTALTISRAGLVVENGGGYDDYMDRILESSDAHPQVLNAVTISGKTAPAGGALNEHVWYDVPTVKKVAEEVAAKLATLEPDAAGTFTANADAFNAKLDQLLAAEADLRAKYAGQAIAITEPVPLYLTEAAGLVNQTPEEFSEAIEEGDDVAPAILKQTLDLFTKHEVAALVYNEQTSGPITEQVKQTADDNAVAVVPVTETLPSGLDYVAWMKKNIADLAAALR